MKKSFLASMFVLFALSSFGQKIRFTDSTNKWKWYLYTCGSTDPYIVWAYTDSFAGDTTINSVPYKKLVNGGHIHPAFIREDSANKKIFVIGALAGDTAEHLLYDFGLNVGDTFWETHSRHYVSSIDSVTINSVWHKVWYMQYVYDTGTWFASDYYVIEGIGCLLDPLKTLSPYFFEDCENLTCFHNQGITPLVTPSVGGYFDNAGSCGLTFGLGVRNDNRENKTTIMPNPIDQSSKIVFPNHISSGSVIVFNDLGQTVINLPFQNKDELLIGDKIKVPGIYYYRLVDNETGKVYSGKFVKQ